MEHLHENAMVRKGEIEEKDLQRELEAERKDAEDEAREARKSEKEEEELRAAEAKKKGKKSSKKKKKKKAKRIGIKERLAALRAIKKKIHRDNKEMEKEEKKVVEVKRNPKDEDKEGMLNKEQLDAVRLMNRIIDKGVKKREKRIRDRERKKVEDRERKADEKFKKIHEQERKRRKQRKKGAKKDEKGKEKEQEKKEMKKKEMKKKEKNEGKQKKDVEENHKRDEKKMHKKGNLRREDDYDDFDDDFDEYDDLEDAGNFGNFTDIQNITKEERKWEKELKEDLEKYAHHTPSAHRSEEKEIEKANRELMEEIESDKRKIAMAEKAKRKLIAKLKSNKKWKTLHKKEKHVNKDLLAVKKMMSHLKLKFRKARLKKGLNASNPIVSFHKIDDALEEEERKAREDAEEIRRRELAEEKVLKEEEERQKKKDQKNKHSDKEEEVEEIQFLSLSDYHGHVEPKHGVGGAAIISSYLKYYKKLNPNTITLTAGDSFGASPPITLLNKEVPTVLAMRMMGIDVDTFGNHNFDEGVGYAREIVKMANDNSLAGSSFDFVASNLENLDHEIPEAKPFVIKKAGNVKVGFVGIFSEEGLKLVRKGSMGKLKVLDPATSAMEAQRKALDAGADIVCCLVHMGIPYKHEGKNELVEFAKSVHGFAVIFGDHTDVQWSGLVNGQMVLESHSYGKSFARTTLLVRNRRNVTNASVRFHVPTHRGMVPNKAIEKMLAKFRKPLKKKLGKILAFSKQQLLENDACDTGKPSACESAIGNTIADSIRVDRTEFSYINTGAIRADLTCHERGGSGFCPNNSSSTHGPFVITRGSLHHTLPFQNTIVSATITGDKLKQIMEMGVSKLPNLSGPFLAWSGLCLTYNISAAPFHRIVKAVHFLEDGICSKREIDFTSHSSYVVSTIDYDAQGSLGLPKLENTEVHHPMIDTVERYLSRSSFEPSFIEGRIRCVGAGCPTFVEN